MRCRLLILISFLSEIIARLLDNAELGEAETSHSKFVSSVVDLLKSGKALKDLGAVVYWYVRGYGIY